MLKKHLILCSLIYSTCVIASSPSADSVRIDCESHYSDHPSHFLPGTEWLMPDGTLGHPVQSGDFFKLKARLARRVAVALFPEVSAPTFPTSPRRMIESVCDKFQRNPRLDGYYDKESFGQKDDHCPSCLGRYLDDVKAGLLIFSNQRAAEDLAMMVRGHCDSLPIILQEIKESNIRASAAKEAGPRL